jgi:hypothetical protein
LLPAGITNRVIECVVVIIIIIIIIITMELHKHSLAAKNCQKKLDKLHEKSDKASLQYV